MAYTLSLTNGKIFKTLGEGALDTSTGLSLIGQNFHNFGQLIGNNFLRLLENQANDTRPINPLTGQLWWDTKNQLLHCFDGNRFKPYANNTVSVDAPVRPMLGDQWFDTNIDQLNIFNGTSWTTIGPNQAKGQLFTGATLISVEDISNNLHKIALVQVNGNNIAILNTDPAFTLSASQSGISEVGCGITLIPNASLTGTSLNSTLLNNVPAEKYLRTDINNTVTGSIAITGTRGLTVGTNGNINISSDGFGTQHITSLTSNIAIQAGNSVITLNAITGGPSIATAPSTGDSITNKRYVDFSIASSTTESKQYTDSKLSDLVGTSPIPTLRALSAAINDDLSYHVNVDAKLGFKANIQNPAFTGVPTAPTANVSVNSSQIATTAFVKSVLTNYTPNSSNLGILNGITVSGPILPTNNRQIDIGSFSNNFRQIYGNAMTANYADLAEIYKADEDYTFGTVVSFGGEYEITMSTGEYDTRIAGVISKDPAYLMNYSADGLPVALTGKVECKVINKVRKGDILVSSYIPGIAMALPNPSHWKPGCVIGKSLEDKETSELATINIVVGRF